MKKIVSLIRACMTSDMNLFKIRSKKKSKGMVIFISLCFMFSIWSYANMLFEQLAPFHLQFIVLSIFVFFTSIFTVIQGIYKSSSLLFNCKDDQLLLSLPIKRSTVLFIRIFKFYVFELLFDILFIVPLVIAYLRWADGVEWTFFLTSFVMLLMIPIIPIVISCIIGALSASVTSRFKYKNIVQTVLSMSFLLVIFYISFQMDQAFEYLAKHATSINDLLTKIYYPAGLYANLSVNFQFKDLLLFVLMNLLILGVAIYVLSRFYFKINSRLKKVTTTKSTAVTSLSFQSKSVMRALIQKEVKTFLNIPVFIINAGFGLFLFLLAAIMLSIKFDSMLPILTDPQSFDLSKDMIVQNTSIFILLLISATAYMTSITNSLISLEGKNIQILKSLPVPIKTILLSKVCSGLVLTTPVLLVGDLILLIRFRISVLESLLLIVLSVLIPLVSHFIGLIINLKFPKLDAESPTEVIKQSTSSFVAVMLGMLLLVVSVLVIAKGMEILSSTLLLTLCVLFYIVIDALLYFYLIKKSTKDFYDLSV